MDTRKVIVATHKIHWGIKNGLACIEASMGRRHAQVVVIGKEEHLDKQLEDGSLSAGRGRLRDML